MNEEMIRARNSQLKFYKDVELFKKKIGEGFILYKPAGMTLQDMRIEEEMHPPVLYIKQSEKIKGIQEAQKGLNKILEADIKSGDSVKETVVTIVEETLTEPRAGSLEGVCDTVDIFVSDYSQHPDVVKQLIDLSHKDFSTVLHSINVMALALGFAFYLNYSEAEAKSLGLSALLHDVGKTKIDNNILTAPRRLTDEEFLEIKSHTTIGYNILSNCKFDEKDISITALEHHEKLDGSGYPNNKTRINKTAQIIGMIDCYEALTNDERPYRKSIGIFNTLKEIIGKEVKSGKFCKDLYTKFVRSLMGIHK